VSRSKNQRTKAEGRRRLRCGEEETRRTGDVRSSVVNFLRVSPSPRHRLNFFILPPSSFILCGRRSQVVRQRSAKPLFIGSIPIAASNRLNNLETVFRSAKR